MPRMAKVGLSETFVDPALTYLKNVASFIETTPASEKLSSKRNGRPSVI